MKNILEAENSIDFYEMLETYAENGHPEIFDDLLCVSLTFCKDETKAKYINKGIENNRRYAFRMAYKQSMLYGNEELNLTDEKAIEYLKYAADNGDKYSQNEFGRLLYLGELVEKDEITACEYFLKAHTTAPCNATYNLARIIELGYANHKPDEKTALSYYIEGAKNNYEPCAEAVARIALKNGDKDLYKSVESLLEHWNSNKKLRELYAID